MPLRSRSVRRACAPHPVAVPGAHAFADKKTGTRFTFVTRSKSFFFAAKTEADATDWVDNLTKAKKEYKGTFGAAV